MPFAMETVHLAPNAQVSLYPWKDTPDKIPLAVRRVFCHIHCRRIDSVAERCEPRGSRRMQIEPGQIELMSTRPLRILLSLTFALAPGIHGAQRAQRGNSTAV